jgi:hypothetical protein
VHRVSALFSVQDDLDTIQPALHLSYARQDSHGIEETGRHLVDVFALGNGEHELGGFERGFYGAQGRRAANPNDSGHTRKQHEVPQRQNWKSQTLGHFNPLHSVYATRPAESIGRATAETRVCAGTFQWRPPIGHGMSKRVGIEFSDAVSLACFS